MRRRSYPLTHNGVHLIKHSCWQTTNVMKCDSCDPTGPICLHLGAVLSSPCSNRPVGIWGQDTLAQGCPLRPQDSGRAASWEGLLAACDLTQILSTLGLIWTGVLDTFPSLSGSDSPRKKDQALVGGGRVFPGLWPARSCLRDLNPPLKAGRHLARPHGCGTGVRMSVGERGQWLWSSGLGVREGTHHGRMGAALFEQSFRENKVKHFFSQSVLKVSLIVRKGRL